MSQQSWLRGRTVILNPTPAVSQSTAPRTGFSIWSIPGKIVGFLWRMFKRLSLIIGAIILISFLFGVVSGLKSNKAVIQTLPSQMVLSLRLDGSLPEKDATSEVLAKLQLEEPALTTDDVVDALDAAAKDERVKALVVKASSSGYDISQLQRLRAAVLRFKAGGKTASIYSESYGDSGYGLGLYYLASAFDDIWMQPVGVVAIGGVDMEAPFFKNIMDQYGIEGQFFQRKEYKNAMEHLTSSQMSSASREETQSIVTDMATQLITPIKTSRPKLAGKMDALVNLGMITDKRALQEGLIDHLDYEDVLLSHLRTTYKSSKMTSVQDYVAASTSGAMKAESAILSSGKTAPTIAVIPVEGMIVSGTAGSSPYGFKESMAGAEDIVNAIEDAANDKSVKTIVFRINSPGGSPAASETIHRAIVWAKTSRKKEIIVSMGALAASGGYWIAAPADKIYAMDATLTGSIGVVGGKINLQGAWKKFGINWESVKYGDNSGMMSMNTPFSASEQQQFEATLDNVYDYFIARVAAGRHMTPEQVEKIARGRVYTGRQAKELGLVDEIGGMEKLLDNLAKKNGLDNRAKLNIVYLPQTEDPVKLVYELISRKIGLSPFMDRISAMMARVAPIVMMGETKGARLVYDQGPLDIQF